MKKCPYCAEEIQDAAIVCRYCGRDLENEKEIGKVKSTTISANSPVDKKKTTQGEVIPEQAKEKSPWVIGAKIAAAFTILAAIGAIVRYSNAPTELFFSLTVGAAGNFIFWWLVCTFFVWLNRKIANKKIVVAMVAIGFLIMCCGWVFFSDEPVYGPPVSYTAPTTTPMPTRTPIPTRIPTRVKTPTLPASHCIHWSQITQAMSGRKICVYGKVYNIYKTNESSTRIKFSSQADSFYLNNTNYIFPDLKEGECIMAEEVLQLYGKIPYMQVSELYYCESWMNEDPTSTSSLSPTETPILPTTTLLCKDTYNMAGSTVECKIPKAYCSYQPATSGRPTFCNDAPYPNNNFSLVVWDSDWNDLDGQCIIVSGTVKLFNGKPQIEATNRSQVTNCSD